MEYTIKMVSKNPLCYFTTNKKGKIESVSGISKQELKKYLPDMKLEFRAPLRVYFRINEWKKGHTHLVIEEAFNKELKRYASPEMLDVIYQLSIDWKQPVKICNTFSGSLDEAKIIANKLEHTQLKLVQSSQYKRTRHEFFLPTKEQEAVRMVMAQREHYAKEMKE